MINLIKYKKLVCTLLFSALFILPVSLHAQGTEEATEAVPMVDEPMPIVEDAVEAYIEPDEADNDEYKLQQVKQEQAIIKKAKAENAKANSPQLNENDWRKIINDKEFEYVKPKEPKPNPKKKEEEPRVYDPKLPNIGFKKEFGVILLYVFIAIALCLLLYALFGGKYIAKRDKNLANDAIPDYDDVEHFTEWERAISDAEAAGDYRKCVRILYNQTLQKLINNHLINYQKEATNSNYLGALYNTVYYQDFSAQTRVFDYVWYGEYNLSSEQYPIAKAGFINFLNKLN